MTALLWLPTSTTATRARTSFAGLGMLASGWLFAKVDPVETHGLRGPVLAVHRRRGAPGDHLLGPVADHLLGASGGARAPRVKARRGLLVLGAALVALVAWETAQRGLVGRPPGAETAWDELMPLLGLIVLLAAGARVALRLPARRPTARHHA